MANPDVVGTHDITCGTLAVSSGNYAITYVKGVLTVSAAAINAENFTQGMNTNFNSTVAAMEGTLLANSGQTQVSAGNPYTLSYSELVSIELEGVAARGADSSVFSGGLEAINQSIFLAPAASRMTDVRDMSIDNPAPQVVNGVIGGTNFVNVEGFASGCEISIEGGAESELTFDFVASPLRAQGSLFEDRTIRMEDFLPEGYDISFTTDNLLKRSNAFKSDYEKLLDEMMLDA